MNPSVSLRMISPCVELLAYSLVALVVAVVEVLLCLARGALGAAAVVVTSASKTRGALF